MNALQHLLHDQGYLTAKARLESQGYTAVPYTGLIPFVFEKVNEPTLYLFRPALDGRSPYVVEVIPHDVLRPAYFPEYGKPVLYIPAADYTAQRKGTVRYYWHPRRLEDAPLFYVEQWLVTKQDISEMLAVSQMNVQYATHINRNRLVEHSSIGGCKLYHTDAVLRWNSKRRGSGPHPTITTPKRRQQAPCKAILVKRMRRYLELGKVSEAALWRSFAAFVDGGKGTGIDDLVTAAQEMKRRVLLPILAKHGVIRLPEATKYYHHENARYAPNRAKEDKQEAENKTTEIEFTLQSKYSNTELAALNNSVNGFGFVYPGTHVYKKAFHLDLISADGSPHDGLSEAVADEVNRRVAAVSVFNPSEA